MSDVEIPYGDPLDAIPGDGTTTAKRATSGTQCSTEGVEYERLVTKAANEDCANAEAKWLTAEALLAEAVALLRRVEAWEDPRSLLDGVEAFLARVKGADE